MNRALPSLHGGSLEITLTVPLNQVEWADTFLKLESHLLLNLSRVERRLGNLKEAEQLAQQVPRHDAHI